MKRLFFLLLLVSGLGAAQDLENMQEGLMTAENTRNFFVVDIPKPFDYYEVPSCGEGSVFTRAQFERGDAAFADELMKNISAYVDRELYVVNGVFFARLSVSRTGQVTDIEIVPKVENSEQLRRELRYSLRKIKGQWSPSKCNNTPIDSKIRITLNFETESIEV